MLLRQLHSISPTVHLHFAELSSASDFVQAAATRPSCIPASAILNALGTVVTSMALTFPSRAACRAEHSPAQCIRLWKPLWYVVHTAHCPASLVCSGNNTHLLPLRRIHPQEIFVVADGRAINFTSSPAYTKLPGIHCRKLGIFRKVPQKIAMGRKPIS